ncbi:AI-2E family transporter [Myroides injenensis]|uniref:AI-2E family transporter n=1 Tax=Myroides injenensis TaxID=1183151 RepID=UPI002271DF04|nr:AI-2E family transporter [Myroides injenensis]
MNNQLKSILPNSVVIQVTFLLVIVFIFFLLAQNLIVFLPGLLGAVCLFVLLIKPYVWLTEHLKWRKVGAILLLMFGSAIVILGPLYILVQTLTKKVLVMLDDKDTIKAGIDKAVNIVQTKYHFDIFNQNNLEKATELGSKALQSIVNTSVNALVEIGVAYLLLYFMLSEYKAMERWFIKYLPISKNNIDSIQVDMKRLVISNTVGVPLTAFCQAVVAYIGYLIFGVDDAFVYFVLTVFAAMVPVVGAALIYLPLVVMLIAQGQTGAAVGLLLYSLILVGLSDNLVRFLLQKRMADVHPLITIFGVIVGVNLFGFIGIIFGPILFSFFFWLIKIYRSEFVLQKDIQQVEKQKEQD